jgi:hypothetical protein
MVEYCKIIYVDSIPSKTTDIGIKLITKATLRKYCPEAAKAFADVEHNNVFWVMTEKPVLNGDVWTQTNESELAEWLSTEWDQHAVAVNGKEVVFLCGTQDDEYGYFWSSAGNYWTDYAF